MLTLGIVTILAQIVIGMIVVPLCYQAVEYAFSVV
jgi:hypothetical protein